MKKSEHSFTRAELQVWTAFSIVRRQNKKGTAREVFESIEGEWPTLESTRVLLSNLRRKLYAAGLDTKKIHELAEMKFNEEFTSQAETLVATYDDLDISIKNLSAQAEQGNHLRIAASEPVFDSGLLELAARQKDAELHCTVGGSEENLAKLNRRECDVAFYSAAYEFPSEYRKNFATREYALFDVNVVFREDSAGPTAEPVTESDLLALCHNQPLVLPARSYSVFRKQVDQYLIDRSIHPSRVNELNSGYSINLAVNAGTLGCTISWRPKNRMENLNLRSLRLDFEPWEIRCACHHLERRPVVKDFFERASEYRPAGARG